MPSEIKEFFNISPDSESQTSNIQPPTTLSTTITAKKTTTMMMTTSSEQINGAVITTTVSSLSSIADNVTKEEDDTVEFMEIEENSITTGGMNNTDITKHVLSDVPALMKRLLKSNEYWYVLDKKWYDSFLAYLENNENYPEKIDNTFLLTPAKNISPKNSEPTYRLKPNVRENEDFVIAPEEVWNMLVQAFDLVEGMGGHPIRCPVISRTESYLQVELYPLELRLALYGSKEDMVVQYSRNCTLREVIADMKKLFHIDNNKPVQLWNNATLLVSYSDDINSTAITPNTNVNNLTSNITFMSSVTPRPPSFKAISNLNQRLLDIVDLEAPNTVLTIEVENPDHTWPSSKTKLGAVTRSKLASGIPNCPPGVCGLMNLGNTCFMNAALQCLSNTAPLTKYFLADHHLVDINPDNPLGMGGEIARCYAELIKSMWSGYHSNIAPREFKIAVTQFAPQFSGFAHHDCQELMAFLLDGLHEDLNRVKVKPYIEMKNDIERRPDVTVATEAWKNYKLRNDSIIVDTFHAQLKSTLVCPECELVSVTFDPFCYLTLPLPYRIERSVDIIFVPAISKRPTYKRNSASACATSTSSEFVMNTTFTSVPVRSILLENIMIPKTGCASDICAAVAKFLNECDPEDSTAYFNRKFDPKKLVVAHIMECRLNKIFSSNDYYNSHLDDIVVYEMDDLPTSSNSESQGCQTRSSSKFKIGHHMPVFIRQINDFDDFSSEIVISRPFFINVKSLTYENIREAILKELTSLVAPEKVNCFLQAMEENIVKVKDVSLSPFSQQNSGGGSDGEDEDMIQESNNSNSTIINDSEEDNDEGVDEAYASSSNSLVALKRKDTYPPYNISVAIWNTRSRTWFLTPGARLDSEHNDLAINIHHSIVNKFFPNNLNRCGFVRLSSMLPNLTPTNTNSLLTLNECINQFTLTEKLGENDPWYCPRCKKHQMASKKFDIWSLPNNLIIHLKRFSYSRLHRDKLNVLVEFPIENLDMSPYVLHNPNNQSYLYDLIAVSNHYGELGAGHYTAYAKNFLSNNWFLFDDYSVTMVPDKNKVMTKAAYVLFYQRKQQPSSNASTITTAGQQTSISQVDESNDNDTKSV